MDWDGFKPRLAKATGATDDVKRRREKAVVGAWEAEQWVEKLIQEKDLGAWLTGQVGLEIRNETVDQLIRAIDGEFSGNPRRWATNFLARNLEKGKKELQWKVRVPTRVISLRLPSPPINAESFSFIGNADFLRAEFIQRWRGEEAAKRNISSGDILFSAIAFAGVLSLKKLIEFTRHCDDGLRHARGITWVEWSKDEDRWERVVLDPLSAALLLRRQTELVKTPFAPDLVDKKSVYKAIQKIQPLRRNGIQSTTRLVKIFRAYWALELPPFIYQWAIRKQASASLPPTAWYRILTGQRILANTVQNQAPETLTVTEETVSPPPEQNTAPCVDFSVMGIRAFLKKNADKSISPAIAVKLLTQFQVRLPHYSLAWLLVDWLIYSLKPKNRGGKGLRVSSARTLLARIDRRLSLTLGSRSPFDVIDDWSNILFEIAESIASRTRGNTASALKSFQLHLETYFEFPPLDLDLEDGTGSNVDANLLSEAEFQLVRTVLARHDIDATSVPCEVAAILGRRTCLRRNEIHCINLADWLGRVSPLLLIRPNQRRQLKSSASRRQIQLASFCTDEEMSVLLKYVRKLQANAETTGISPSAYAFFPSEEQHLNQLVSERILFSPIEKAMRQVTGDETLRFHHLRHSAINFNTLCSLDDLVPDSLPLLTRDARGELPLPKNIRKALVGDADQIRMRLWGVAAAAGHTAPDTTLGSYFHLCDWVLYNFGRRLVPSDDLNLAALAGVTVSNLRVLRHRSEADVTPVSIILQGITNSSGVLLPPAEYEDISAYAEKVSDLMEFDSSSRPSTTRALKILNSLAELIAPRPAAVQKLVRHSEVSAKPRKPSKSRTRHFISPEKRDPHFLSIAEQFAVPLDHLKSWWGLIEELDSLRGTGPANKHLRKRATPAIELIEKGELKIHRPVRLPMEIRSEKEMEHTATLDRLFQQIMRIDRRLLERFLTSYWSARSSDEQMIRTGSVAEALDLHLILMRLEEFAGSEISFLQGKHLCQIRYVLHASPNSARGDDMAQKIYWAQSLSIAPELIVAGQPMGQARHKIRPDGVLAIYLEFIPEITKSGLQKRKSRETRMVRKKQRSVALDAAAYAATLWLLTDV
jgi:hypothetical protein